MGVSDVSPTVLTRPPLTRRADFADFWADTRAALARTAAAPTLGVTVRAPHGGRIVPVRFRSLGNQVVQGFLVTREAADPAPGSRRPLIVTAHGYNSACNPVLVSRHAAKGDADLFCFDVRGCGRSRPGCVVDPHGFVLTGLGAPDTSILRGAVCDYLRAAEVGELVRAATGPVVFHGRSFSGALAIMAQAVSGAAAYLPVSVPTLGWADGRRRLVEAGSGAEINTYLARHPGAEPAVMHTLSYFDPMNFADRIRCRALIGVGRRDVVVPAATVYAIVNHMTPRPEVVELPVSHSDDLEERHWTSFDRRWTTHVAELQSS